MLRAKLHKLLAFMCLWLWWSACIYVDAAGDSLKAGDTMNFSSALHSKSRKYFLEFYLLGKSSNYYLGIQKAYDNFIVWTGNREESIYQTDAVLSLNFSGVLKIESQIDKKRIILYSPPQPINNTMATLLDTGNFVLQQVHPNGTNTLLWQSFDYPTDFLLPTMKLGVNHKTGHHWSLVSWVTNERVAPGAFSLEWEPAGQELFIRRRGKVCWRSGKLRSNRFEHIPEDAQRVLKYSIVSNQDEDSFSFTSTNENHTRWWCLSSKGQLSYNNEEGYVARADLCYGYNNSDGGCQRWQEIPMCRNPGDVFTKKILHPNYDDAIYDLNYNISYSDCEASCWSNCSCNGFKEFFSDGTGCKFYHWNSSENYTIDSTVFGVDFYILENIGNIAPHHHGRSNANFLLFYAGTERWIWISPVIATAVIICVSILCLAIKKRKYVHQEKKRKEMVMKMQKSETCDGLSPIKDFGNGFRKGHDLEEFDYTLVVTATNGFSSENKLGQGGFGPVYKGILPIGKEVAVKRLSKSSAQGIVEFKNELTLISELQHMNLVQLLGCCIHEEEKILIYEYMANKSLDFYIF
ncbi:unnamed protein product, partial [Sphenostylis stenocarpa]